MLPYMYILDTFDLRSENITNKDIMMMILCVGGMYVSVRNIRIYSFSSFVYLGRFHKSKCMYQCIHINTYSISKV